MFLSYNEACTLHNSNLEQDLLLCEQAGFPYMELRLDKLKVYLESHTIQDLQAFFKAHKIKPNTINGIYVYEALFGESDDLRRRSELLADVRLACGAGKALGVDSMVIVPPMNSETENCPYISPWAHTVESLVRILTFLADLAAPYSMGLALEIVGSRRCAVRTIGQAREVIAKTGRANVGYAIDAYNLFMHQKSNDYSALRMLDPAQIYIVHINNAEDRPLSEMRQAHRTFCSLTGAIDLEGFLGALKAIGYIGSVSVEVFRPDLWEKPADVVINEAYRTTLDIMKSCGAVI